MKKITLAITLVTFANIAVAGGLTDSKVIPPPMIGNATACKDENKGTISDYTGAFNHYFIAVGQSAEKAAKSAQNALAAHAEAQTCNTNTKAVTDGNGHAVRDGNGDVVTNTPT